MTELPSIEEAVRECCVASREAARHLARMHTAARNEALLAAAAELRRRCDAIVDANRDDLEVVGDVSAAFRERMTLTPERVEAMARGVEEIVLLRDPVGETIEGWRRPNGLEIRQVRIPLGVIGFIYESRPNVTADAAALCLKSGNAVVLKGGKEAIRSNSAIADCFVDALAAHHIPAGAVQLIRSTDRAATRALLHQSDLVDVLIPRGGEGLIRAITEESEIPVIKHLSGICQVYVDRDADPNRAEAIVVNAKAQRPSVCNAMENLLVDVEIAESILPRLVAALRARDVEIRGCERTRALVPDVIPATEEDWATEYLDLILSVRVVDGLEDAIAFIDRYGSGLADAIVTENYSTANRFTDAVDSSATFVNASTRFNDGFEFGFGAEIGISTNRLHARGPMGLRELTTYKYVVLGEGQTRG